MYFFQKDILLMVRLDYYQKLNNDYFFINMLINNSIAVYNLCPKYYGGLLIYTIHVSLLKYKDSHL